MVQEGFGGGGAGWALAALYARGVALARAHAGRRPRIHPACPVISIGNLAVGGTGKTPLTVWAAERLLSGGLRVAIVARPVGGAVPGAAGDEIGVLEELVPGVRVHAARNKGQGALEAARGLAAAGGAPAAILVDDAFSHWALARDLDVVLVDAARPLGNGHVLPLGRLREPPGALARAQVVIATRAERVSEGARSEIGAALARLAPRALLAEARLAPRGVRAEGGRGPRIEPETGRTVVCLSGLARAGELAATAASLGLVVEADMSYADHHRFSDAEWRRAASAADRAGAWLLMSRKDAVRLSPERRKRVHVLDVTFEFLAGGNEVERLLIQTVRAPVPGGPP